MGADVWEDQPPLFIAIFYLSKKFSSFSLCYWKRVHGSCVSFVPLEQFLVLTWTIFNGQFNDNILLKGRKEQWDHKPGSKYKSFGEET